MGPAETTDFHELSHRLIWTQHDLAHKKRGVMNTKPLKWYYSAGFSHIPTKKTELLFSSFTFQKFQRIDTQNDQKNWSQRCIFHHNKPHRLMFLMVNIPTSQRIGVGAGFIATIFFRQLGISPGPGVFFCRESMQKVGEIQAQESIEIDGKNIVLPESSNGFEI